MCKGSVGAQRGVTKPSISTFRRSGPGVGKGKQDGCPRVGPPQGCLAGASIHLACCRGNHSKPGRTLRRCGRRSRATSVGSVVGSFGGAGDDRGRRASARCSARDGSTLAITRSAIVGALARERRRDTERRSRHRTVAIAIAVARPISRNPSLAESVRAHGHRPMVLRRSPTRTSISTENGTKYSCRGRARMQRRRSSQQRSLPHRTWRAVVDTASVSTSASNWSACLPRFNALGRSATRTVRRVVARGWSRAGREPWDPPRGPAPRRV